jgi:hypothetical protein
MFMTCVQLDHVKNQHGEIVERFRRRYEMPEGAERQREMSLMRARLQSALAAYEVKVEKKALQKAVEREALLKEVSKRAEKQEERRQKVIERDDQICSDEMSRLLEVARQHPFL